MILYLTGDSKVNGLASLNCMPQPSVCNGEKVVCSCTANCSEVIHWWNGNIYFCTFTTLYDSGNRSGPPVNVEVIPNNCNLNSSGTFTSRLTFNASLDVVNSTDTQIGCFSSSSSEMIFDQSNCIPIREPSGREQNNDITLCVTNCTGMEKHINTVLQSRPYTEDRVDNISTVTRECNFIILV